nr:PREDICTED: coiled-coil domain-containing protein 113-like [Anolis carolinensis]|eukprot:XP_008123235.1 PREDICTED: coiled-coil domain-containing protein 113-like [Anolis carolinensis]
METSSSPASLRGLLAMADEDSERESSVLAGESRELGEELRRELSQLSLISLAAANQQASHENALLKLETDMFEKFFNRMEPRERSLDKRGSSVDMTGQMMYLQARARRKSRSRIPSERLICLTVEQKCDLAQRELDETKEDIQRMKEISEKAIQNYLAVLEEADIRRKDVKKATVDFDREIIRTITKKKGSIIASNKVLRYMEDRIRSRDILKEKIRLKNDALKVQKKKMQLQLKQKEELGEALHEVDFQQLKIENAQFLEKIDERNQELLQLKMMVASTLQVLNFHRKKLQAATALAAHVVKDMAQRKDILDRIDHEAILAEHEREVAEALNRRLRGQMAEYTVPPVLNYVRQKMALQELGGNFRIWERKVEIAEMTLQSYRSTWHKAKMASQELHALLPEKQASSQMQVQGGP